MLHLGTFQIDLARPKLKGCFVQTAQKTDDYFVEKNFGGTSDRPTVGVLHKLPCIIGCQNLSMAQAQWKNGTFSKKIGGSKREKGTFSKHYPIKNFL